MNKFELKSFWQDSSRRQSPEVDQPEDEPNPSRGERGSKKEQTVIVAIKVGVLEVVRPEKEFLQLK